MCHTTYSCNSERKCLHNSAPVPCHWLAQRKRTGGSSSWSWDQGVLSSRSALCKLLSLPSWFIHYLRYWISMQLPMSPPGVFGPSPVLGRVSQYRPKLPRSQLVETARLECCSAGIIYPSAFCHQTWHWEENPPAPKVLGRDRPDGTRKRLQVYLGGGIFRPKPPVFDRSWRSPSKNTVKNSTEDTCSWTRPSKIGKRKVKKTRVFQLFDLNFLVCNIFFCGSAGGPEADFWVFGPVFGLIFVVLW